MYHNMDMDMEIKKEPEQRLWTVTSCTSNFLGEHTFSFLVSFTDKHSSQPAKAKGCYHAVSTLFLHARVFVHCLFYPLFSFNNE